MLSTTPLVAVRALSGYARLFAIPFIPMVLWSTNAAAAAATWQSSPTNGNWEAAGAEANWSTGAGTYPGDILGSTTNTDVATFLSSSVTNILINATTPNSTPLNLGGITFGVAGSVPSSFTIGTTNGNALSLSSGGTVQILSGISGANITETINAPLILQGASATTAGSYTFRNDSSTVSNTMILNGSITGGTTTGAVTLTLRGGNTGTNTVNGLISKGNATSMAVQKSDGSTWILTNRANSYNGNTTVGGGILQARDTFTYTSGDQTLTGGGAMGTGQVVINGGTLQLRINGDNTSAAQILTYQNSSLFANNSTTSTISVDRATGTSAQNKTLSFASVSASRGGKLTVTGDNGYRLRLNNMNISGSGSGTYTLNPIGADITISGTLNNNTDSSTATLALDGTTQGNIISANISNTVGSTGTGRIMAISKTGTSTWEFTGTNTYTGDTTVSGGTLLINGSHTAGVGTYGISNGGTLAGIGSITATSLVASAGSKLGAGSLGTASNAFTFSLSGGMDLSAASNNTGAYLFDLASVGASDKITLTLGTLNVGTLDFTDFTFNALSGFGAGTYTLFDASSAITGALGVTSGTINGLTATLSIDAINNDILLTVVPEPATLGLFGLAAVALALVRRKQVTN